MTTSLERGAFLLLLCVIGSCRDAETKASLRASDSAGSRVAELGRRFGFKDAGSVQRFDSDGTNLRAVVTARAVRSAKVVLPLRASDPVRIEDETSGMAVSFSIRGVHAALAEITGGIALYRGAFAEADLIHRAGPEGTEDFVVFERQPAREELNYAVDVSQVAGLRLVSNTLELLDAAGTPQLRVAPPYVIDARGDRHAATLDVVDCAYDTNPSGPWGRSVTRAGSARCTVRVSWSHVPYPAMVDPAWGTTGSMATIRTRHAQVLLPGGRVLVSGGFDDTSIITSAELYDAGTFAATGSMATPRLFHTLTPLSSGKILVVGGFAATGGVVASAEVYSPVAGTFAPTGLMAVAREFHTASALASGKVLIAGGSDGIGSTHASAELFDPAGSGGVGSFTATGSMAGARNRHTASVLASGKVLVVGGSKSVALSTVEVFDPATGTFTSTGSMSTARDYHSASVLPSGRVLVAGGTNDNGTTTLASAELFDPVTASFLTTGAMAAGRNGHTASPLPSGKVLIAGGSSAALGRLSSAELFDPGGAGTFASAGSMATRRESHTATTLLSGKVLVTGGFSGLTLASAELFGGTLGEPCTAGGTCLSGFCADGVCCNAACSGGGCDRCDLAGKVGSCTIAPPGNSGANPACVSPLACDGSSAACPASCATDSACASTHYCSGDGSCKPQKLQGVACNPSTDCKGPNCRECANGFCVDGFCCDQACTGTCQACASNLTQNGAPNGTCGPTKDGTDPRAECAPAAEICGGDGQCNGTGACRLTTPVGVSCGGGKVCDGSGKCAVPSVPTCDGDHTTLQPNGETQDCGAYKCNSNGTCKAKCGSVDDCVAPSLCDPAGACVGPDAPSESGCSSSAPAPTTAPWILLAVIGLAAARRRAPQN